MSKSHKKVYDFLENIGIKIQLKKGIKGFLGKLLIKDGGLVIDPTAPIGDILHEAGHIAIMPEKYRKEMNWNVKDSIEFAFSDLSALNTRFDAPVMIHLMQCSDSEACAWQRAAGEFLGLQRKTIWGNKKDLMEVYGLNRYPLGAHGLAHAGFCQVGIFNPYNPLPQYPKLIRWLQI